MADAKQEDPQPEAASGAVAAEAKPVAAAVDPEPEPIKLTEPTFIKISDCSPASVGINFFCKVSKITTVINRLNLDGTRLRISEALIGDETGLVLLSLRNDQIDLVKEGMSLIMRGGLITL